MNVGARENIQWQSNATGFAEGLHYYQNNELGLVEIKDTRPTDIKVKDAAQSLVNHSKVIYDRCRARIEGRNASYPVAIQVDNDIYTYPEESLPWNSSEESTGLYFFIHGLAGSPSDWNAYKDGVQEDLNAHIFAPEVVLTGNCRLETAGRPLLEALEHYLKKFPGRPVTIVGTSNGGRLGFTYIEANLDPEILGSSRLTVSSLSGVMYGTTVIDIMKNARLLPFMDEQLKEEFCFGSQSAKTNLLAWKAKQDVWKEKGKIVHHLLCATTEDAAVRDICSSLPYHKSASSTYIVVRGESHSSIVEALRPDVLQWLKLHR